MQHPAVSQEIWLAQREELLRKEKELTRLHDQLAAERRASPWVKIEKETNEFADADKPYWLPTESAAEAACGCQLAEARS